MSTPLREAGCTAVADSIAREVGRLVARLDGAA